MHDRSGRKWRRRAGLAALMLSAALVVDTPASAGECRPQVEGRQCVAACDLAVAVTACAIATRSAACLCAPSSTQQECECFADPPAAASSAIVGLAGDRAAPERWVGAIFGGYPTLTRSLANEIDSLAAQPGTGTATLCYRGCYWIAPNGAVSWHDPSGITELGCWTPSHGGVGVAVYGSCAVS
jgi:hypothetical protein